MLIDQGWTVVKLIQTNHNGMPDLMCLKQGKTFFIEVKAFDQSDPVIPSCFN